MIEIVIAMSIVALIFVVSIFALRSADSERKFREPASYIEGMAKQARSLSLMQRREYQLIFDAKGVTLEPVSNFLEDGDEGVLRLFEDEDQAQAPDRFDEVTDRYELPEDMKIEVKGWRQDWFELKRDRTFVWAFRPEELVEPVEVRVSSEDGYIKQRYNPLTGAVDDEGYEFR